MNNEQEPPANVFPPGWNDQRVRNVLEHYEPQPEDEAVAEDDAAFADKAHTVMLICQ